MNTKKLLIIPALALVLMGAGCSQSDTNDDNIIEYKKCIDAGMIASTFNANVICLPPGSPLVNSDDEKKKQACYDTGGVPNRSAWDGEWGCEWPNK